MPTIAVQGKQIPVSDGFFKLSPDEQAAIVREIIGRSAGKQIGPAEVNNPAASSNSDLSQPRHSWPDLPANIVPSAVNSVAGLWDMLTHPQRTAETIVDTAQGSVDRIVPEAFTNFMDAYVSPRSAETRERQRQVSGALGQALKDRYWGLENLKKTMITDPTGIALDAGGLAAGGMGLVRAPLSLGSKVRQAKSATTAIEDIVPKNSMTQSPGASALGSRSKLDDKLQERGIETTPNHESPANTARKPSEETSQSIVPPNTRIMVPRPSIIRPDTNLVVPTPHIIRASGPNDRLDDIEFTPSNIPWINGLPAPWGRSDPWIVSNGPLGKAPRDSALDYPNGATVDEHGNLLKDIDDRDFVTNRIAGRRKLGEKDVGFTLDDIRSILGELNVPIFRVPRSDLKRGIGQYQASWTGPGQIDIWDRLPDDQANVVLGHEFGHVIDRLLRYPRTRGLNDELDRIYSENKTGQLNPRRRAHPRDSGIYTVDEYRGEKMAEAIRTQVLHPNTIKTIAPKTAALLRERINTHPILSPIFQVNGIPIGILAGAGATAIMGTENDSRAQQPGKHSDASVPDTKINMRKIAAVLPRPVRRKAIPATIELIARALLNGRAPPSHGGPR